MLNRLALDAIAEVIPLERELTRDPLFIDHGFIVRKDGREWVEHIEAYSRFPGTTVVLMVKAYDPGEVPPTGRIQNIHRVKRWPTCCHCCRC
ncbi:MAG: hypothetical protein HY820_44665 [Acidobacteria bacterium]|nr:hypothetical protein [Acidobacteriota bacterium]